MSAAYVATVRQNPGRRALIVDFRHPLRTDPSNQGKSGRKVRKGLGTEDRAVADALVLELNTLLADPSFHSPAARSKAESIFDPRVVEIFYEGIEPKRESNRALRDAHLPFPPREEGYPRILILGVPGAGKTTLVRQFIGCHPERDRFPSTSVNRTTTFETEVIVGSRRYSAVITFMSEEETDFETRQSVSGALLRAIDASGSDSHVAKAFLERSDMRFRLKYLLGDWPADEVDDDPYETDAERERDLNDTSCLAVSSAEAKTLANKLRRYVSTIRKIAVTCREEIEKLQGPIDLLSPDERNTALDWLQEMAEDSDAYAALVSEILDDLRERFKEITAGRLLKTTTGWPRLWLMDAPIAQRSEFLTAVRFFSGIDRRQWGRLFTPLVSGMRVAGPFVPTWEADGQAPRLVLIDTEGLGHKANTTPDVPDYVIAHFAECDAILLVHKGDVPFTFEGGKVLEAIGGAGQTAKTMMVFSRMDAVKGDNIKGWQAKRDYVFSGVRNVSDHQIAKSLTPEVARFMLAHLERHSFYVGSLQDADPRAARSELNSLLKRLTSIVPPPAPARAFPIYSYDLLVLALQKGVEGFRIPWRAYLGLERHSDLQPLPWQSVKAVSRRYAEGFDDGYPIRPASNLLNTMTLAIGRFLENPIRWEGNSTPAQRRLILDRVKAAVSEKLRGFCVRQVREKPRPEWQQAYAFRGEGTTLDRKMKIETLYERWVPIPASESDDMQHVQEFIEALKRLVETAIKTSRDALAREVAESTNEAA